MCLRRGIPTWREMMGCAVRLLGTPANRLNCYRPLSLPIETGDRMIFSLYKIVNLCVCVCVYLCGKINIDIDPMLYYL